MIDFLHPLLALGAATFAIPIVIHLIFRMRKKRVVFSSLRFLQQSMLKESKRIKLRELLLLLLRCLACILIALAFARPFYASSALGGSVGRLAQDMVLVVDDSPSMAALEGSSSRWQEAQKQARTALAECFNGDRAGLVLASDPARAEIELSGNFSAVSGALKNEQPSPKRGDLAAAINTALDLLAQSAQPRRRVVVFSDFQMTAVDRGAWASLAQKAAATGRGIGIELQGPASQSSGAVRLNNLAVTDVRAKSDVWIEGRPVPFTVRISNTGNNEMPYVTIKLVLDGKVAASRIVGMGPRSSTEIELEAQFPKAGEVCGWAEVEAHDCFPDDDKRHFALRLRDSIRVLVVEERLGEKDAFLDQSYFVRMALDPKARGGEDAGTPLGGGNYCQVQALEAAKVTPENYRNADLIVLCGITALTDLELILLEDAVRDGKNLIVFAGRSDGRLSDSFYNGAFWKNGVGLLPARPGALFEGNRLENKFDKIGEFNVAHPLFMPFTGENDANLRLPRYYRHFVANPIDLKIGAENNNVATPPSGTKTPVPLNADKLGDPKSAAKSNEQTSRPEGKVLATFTGDGGPFAMERAFGKGTVLLFPFAPRPEATDLPKRKAFVPLLHQAVRWLAGVQAASRRSLQVGEVFDFADAGAAPEVPISLEKPATASSPKEILSVNGSEHPVAERVGIYTAAFVKGNIKERSRWAVNIDPRESELVADPLGSLKTIFAMVVQENSAVKPSVMQLSDEQKALAPEWRWLLLAALLCLLLEVAIRDFGRHVN